MSLLPYLNEKQKRIAAAVEARSLGYGGISEVAAATGLSRTTIHRAMEELEDPKIRSEMRSERVRTWGGGRKKIAVQNPVLVKKLKSFVESTTRGDPMYPLLWTSKSTRYLAQALSQEGFSVSHRVIADMLREMGYNLRPD